MTPLKLSEDSFQYTREIKIVPWLYIAVSNSGIADPIEYKGDRFIFKKDGTRSSIASPPKRSIYYVEHEPWYQIERTSKKNRIVEKKTFYPKNSLIKTGFFSKIMMSKDEKSFIKGIIAFSRSQEEELEKHLEKTSIEDASFLYGCFLMKKGENKKALEVFLDIYKNKKNLGEAIKKHNITLSLPIPITDTITGCLSPSIHGILIGLSEAYQKLKDYSHARDKLEELLLHAPNDLMVKLSLSELLLAMNSKDKKIHNRIIKITEGINSQQEEALALLLCQAKALRRLGNYNKSRIIINKILKKKRLLGKTLVRATRYERALLYEKIGQTHQSESELQKLLEEIRKEKETRPEKKNLAS